MPSHNTTMLCLANHLEKKNVDIFSKEVNALLEYGGKCFKLALICVSLLVIIKTVIWSLERKVFVE